MILKKDVFFLQNNRILTFNFLVDLLLNSDQFTAVRLQLLLVSFLLLFELGTQFLHFYLTDTNQSLLSAFDAVHLESALALYASQFLLCLLELLLTLLQPAAESPGNDGPPVTALTRDVDSVLPRENGPVGLGLLTEAVR